MLFETGTDDPKAPSPPPRLNGGRGTMGDGHEGSPLSSAAGQALYLEPHLGTTSVQRSATADIERRRRGLGGNTSAARATGMQERVQHPVAAEAARPRLVRRQSRGLEMEPSGHLSDMNGGIHPGEEPSQVRALQEEVRELKRRLERAERQLVTQSTGSSLAPEPPKESQGTLFQCYPNAYFECDGRAESQALVTQHEDAVVREVSFQHDKADITIYWCPRRPASGETESDVAGDFFALVRACPAVVGASKPIALVLSVFSSGEELPKAVEDADLRELHTLIHYQLFASAVKKRDRALAYACLPPLTALVNELYENALPMLERYYRWFDDRFLAKGLPDSETGDMSPELQTCCDAVTFQTVVTPLMYLASICTTAVSCAAEGERRRWNEKARLLYSRVLRYLREASFSRQYRDAAALHQHRASRLLAAVLVRAADSTQHEGLREDRLSEVIHLLRRTLDDLQSSGDPITGSLDDKPSLLRETANTTEELARLYQRLPSAGNCKPLFLRSGRLRCRYSQLQRHGGRPLPLPKAVLPPAAAEVKEEKRREENGKAGPNTSAGEEGANGTGSEDDGGAQGSLEVAAAVAAAAAADDGGVYYDEGSGLNSFRLPPSRPNRGLEAGAVGTCAPSGALRGVETKVVQLVYPGSPPEGRGFRVAMGEGEAETLGQVRGGLGLSPDAHLEVRSLRTGEVVRLVYDEVHPTHTYVV
eukprot:Hpha_TRINITY_DN16338_c2_g4::TRINITY_DN16338_c2_g4_i1::g.57728::m.57728